MDFRSSQELRDRHGTIAWWIGDFVREQEAWVLRAEMENEDPINEQALADNDYMELTSTADDD